MMLTLRGGPVYVYVQYSPQKLAIFTYLKVGGIEKLRGEGHPQFVKPLSNGASRNTLGK